MRSAIADRIMTKATQSKPLKLDKPFWFDFPISWRQLYWIEQFLSAKYYKGRNPEIDLPEGKLIFYKDGTSHFIKTNL